MYGTKFRVYTQPFHHGTTMPAKSDDESKNMSNLRLQLRPGDMALRGRRHCTAREVPQAADVMINEGTRGLGYDPLARRGPSAAWTVSRRAGRPRTPPSSAITTKHLGEQPGGRPCAH